MVRWTFNTICLNLLDLQYTSNFVVQISREKKFIVQPQDVVKKQCQKVHESETISVSLKNSNFLFFRLFWHKVMLFCGTNCRSNCYVKTIHLFSTLLKCRTHFNFFFKFWESVQGKKAADELAKYISSVKGKQFKIETWLYSYKEDQKGRDRQANFFFFFQFTHFKNSHPYYIIMQLPGIQYS